MALFDSIESIRERATEAAQTAANKTKKLAEIAKANLSIYSEEDKIKKAQLELGKLYYRDYVVGEEMDAAEYLPFCKQIDESKETIADLQDYIDNLKNEHVDMDAVNEEVTDVVEVEDWFAREEEQEEPQEEASPMEPMEVIVCEDEEPEVSEAPTTEE